MTPSARFLLPLSLASLALLGAPGLSLAQALMIDVRDCIAFEAVLERYACYEEKVAAAKEDADRRAAPAAPARQAAQAASPPAAVLPAPAAPAAPARPAERPTEAPGEEFGFRKKASELARESEEQVEELHSSISQLEETVPDRFLITLENGQVWRSMTSKKYHLQVGQDVRIYPTTWGQAYRLTVPELRGFIQVERVR